MSGAKEVGDLLWGHLLGLVQLKAKGRLHTSAARWKKYVEQMLSTIPLAPEMLDTVARRYR